MRLPDDEPSDPELQPRWVTHALLALLGVVTISFWGGIIWLSVSVFR
ncbi:hypothetical protein [Brevundimonas variabilis]|uniref:Uncharacterized protein n=1 Tax=Brevundimonas variabilis TaxID=74312 RepID=A0A7W9CIN0_9CAUL|nr:hypothetical protein [Brevundimonas variabilis]MBB5746363.1 hypothetical protein [Brevundimonas variabilis]